jgi:hypothetical protein
MFNQEAQKTQAYSPKVGPAEMQVFAVNYSKEEYKEITGRELPYEPNYSPIDREGEKVHKLTFLTHGPGGFVDMTFWIGENDRKESQSGKYEWVNSQGQTWWTDDPTGNTDYSWINTSSYRRRTRSGETNLLSFLINLCNFPFHPEPTRNDLDFVEVFDGRVGDEDFSLDGSLSGFKNLIAGVNQKDLKFTGIYEVSVDEQVEPVKLRQRINTRNTFRQRSLKYAQKIVQKAIDTGDQYFSSNLYLDTFAEVSCEPEAGKVCYQDLAGYNGESNGASPANFKSFVSNEDTDLPF